ncbi:MAG TPA: lipocalin family protein [Ktedonobacterales bacterium]|nr:lipocalin family protein [Ktedonobacterales bacterium]
MNRTRRLSLALGVVGALALLFAGCGLPGTIATTGHLPAVSASPTVAPLPPVRFPQDEAPHHDLMEWWYYTGHLHGTDAQGHARTYGFELVFFQTLRGQFSPFYAAHFAVSDITHGQFHYDQRAGLEPASVIPPAGSTQGFNVSLGGWSARGLGGHDTLAATMPGYAIDLRLTGAKPAALHNGDGLISYGPAGFSYYYSRPLMRVSGTITDGGLPISVTGQAWMDHQWGNFVSLAGSGWDWYSLQLANNTEYMLYIIRDTQRRPIAVFGTAVAPDGTARAIHAADISIRALGSWTSPHTGGIYPSGWQVTLASEQVMLQIMPLLRDQELVTAASTGVAYWEGAVSITGDASGAPVAGEGYVELTGYASIPSSNQGASVP